MQDQAKRLTDAGIKIVGVPKTVDNDLSATDYTFGFDTAVEIATEAMDRLRTTGDSHGRCMVAEVMGRHVGWIALHSGMAAGALSALVQDLRRYHATGEINFEVADSAAAIERILARYAPLGPVVDRTDGVSVEFADWRFNLRASNTEPLLRLNVESRGDAGLMRARTAEIAGLIAAPTDG